MFGDEFELTEYSYSYAELERRLGMLSFSYGVDLIDATPGADDELRVFAIPVEGTSALVQVRAGAALRG